MIGILDLDGFEINGEFFCKELGLMRVKDGYANSYLFEIPLRWEELDERTKRQCDFLMRKIHRLPFWVPDEVDAYDLGELRGIVMDFYTQNRVDDSSKLAFKGGWYEKSLLTQLRIPFLNLEDFGCPKAERLFNELGWLETCGNHLRGRDTYKHCPKVEVEAYECWLIKEFILNLCLFAR